LHRIAAERGTNDPQVADRKGNSGLSTQAVDKFVHECVREEFCAGNAGFGEFWRKKRHLIKLDADQSDSRET
jgi:hypothetical protein